MLGQTVQVVLLAGSLATTMAGAAVDVPVVRDPRLRLELLTIEPDIGTPLGIALDSDRDGRPEWRTPLFQAEALHYQA